MSIFTIVPGRSMLILLVRSRKIFYAVVCWSFLLVHFTVAANQEVPVAKDSFPRLLTSSADLVSMKAMPDVVVLDVRDPEMYGAGHIPGAINLPEAKTYRQNGRTDRVGKPAYIQKLFSQAGITQQKRVIIYDDGSFINAGRVFWVLEVYGHTKVQLLDGGFPAWQADGLSVSMEAVSPKPGDFIAMIQPEKLVTKLRMRLATRADKSIILDARSQDEYAGFKSITDRYGHIPQAINIPWGNNVNSGGDFPQMKTFPELQQVYAGLDKNKKILTYCNKGKGSSFAYFVLRQMGLDVAHYDGSWFEWSSDVSLPIVSP
jgi:thiosulfate/3-mercaptopyruvate sulfurtransferase